MLRVDFLLHMTTAHAHGLLINVFPIPSLRIFTIDLLSTEYTNLSFIDTDNVAGYEITSQLASYVSS